MIWCVEDDASIRDIEVYALTSTGFEARGFEDGDSFWDALQHEKPELVVLDVMLPGKDGVELLKMMKASDHFRDIPVIMATAKGTEYDKIQSLDLGADDYLVKPFNVERVVKTLSRIKGEQAAVITPEAGETVGQSERYSDKLLIKGKEQVTFLDKKDIIYMERIETTTNIVTKDRVYVTSVSLGNMEEKLNPVEFMRTHKSYIINVSQITQIEPYGRWTFVVKFRGTEGTALMTTKSYEEIRKIFE